MRKQLKMCNRTGGIVPLGALFLVIMVVAVVFAVEIGRIGIIQSELQRAADAGALSACWELASKFNKAQPASQAMASARLAAQNVVSKNVVRSVEPALDANLGNLSDGDITFGKFNEFGDPAAMIDPVTTNEANAVQVWVHMDDVRNGSCELGLAKLLGFTTFGTKATATAAWVREIRGFKTPSVATQTLPILPFAIKKTEWDKLINGTGPDNWTWNTTTKTVSSGGDGIKEINMFPGTVGASGNFGTIDIGSSNNSTNDLKRQISQGVSGNDLSYLGGKFELGSNGTLSLNGDTGISAAIGAELSQVIGKPCVVSLFTTVSGNGNNAYYTITKFVGIRIVEVKLTGNPKRIMVQPAIVTVNAVIPSTTETSEQVYSPIVLVN